MKIVSNFMLGLMERLAEMFPGSSYQARAAAVVKGQHWV